MGSNGGYGSGGMLLNLVIWIDRGSLEVSDFCSFETEGGRIFGIWMEFMNRLFFELEVYQF